MKTKTRNHNLVVTQLRTRLEEQVSALERYLSILETQEEAIVDGNYESQFACIEQNNFLIQRMQDIQKVISPLEQLYQDVCPEEHQTIEALHNSVELLRVKAINHSHCLAGQMRLEMDRRREEIHSMPAFQKEVFSEEKLARHIDVQV